MKKLLGFVTLVPALCLVNAAAVRAEVVMNGVAPVSADVFVPCANGGAGETIHVEGNLHITISMTVNGNHGTAKAHTQQMGVSGVGLTTGDKYQASGTNQETFTFNFINGQTVHTQVINFHFIGQGQGNNITGHETDHLTINANGTFTATVDNVHSDCK